MKKLLLTLGTLAAVVTPVATVIACGSTDTKTWEDERDATVTKMQKVADASSNQMTKSTIQMAINKMKAAKTEAEYKKLVADKSGSSIAKTWEEQKDAEVTELTNKLATSKNPYEKQGYKSMLNLLKVADTEVKFKAISTHTDTSLTGLASDKNKAIETLKDFAFATPADLATATNAINAATDVDGINTIIGGLTATKKEFVDDKQKMLKLWSTRLTKIAETSAEYKMMIPFYNLLLVSHDRASVDAVLGQVDEFGSPLRS